MTEDGDAAPKVKLSKAERLEAKAARLRAEQERRAADAAAGRTPGPRAGMLPLAVLGAIALALAAALVVFVVAWVNRGDELSRQRAVMQRAVAAAQHEAAAARIGNVNDNPAVAAAKTFALDFGSYDYRHLDTDFAEVAKRMTPSFAKSYTETSDKLKPTFEQYKTQVTAQLQGWGLTSATLSEAVVVVFLDQTVRTSQSATPRIDRNRLEIQLVHSDGKWLVAKLLAK